MKKCCVLVVLLAFVWVGMIVKGNVAEAKGSDGVLRYQGSANCAVQVNSKIYYSTQKAGYIYCYDVKRKTNKKLAKIPGLKKDKHTVYGYPTYSNITSIIYYKGYLYCELREYDYIMSNGIIRVNVKTGKVKRLHSQHSSDSHGPIEGGQLSVYNNKIYYAYSTGSIWHNNGKEKNRIKMYFASMNLDGSHKKIIEQKRITKIYRSGSFSGMFVLNDCLYVRGNKNYKVNKKGKFTRINAIPQLMDGMKNSTSGCVTEFENGFIYSKYKGYSYDANWSRLSCENLATGEQKLIYGKYNDKNGRSYVVLGDYVLVVTNKYMKKSNSDRETIQLIDNKGKKVADLYQTTIKRQY